MNERKDLFKNTLIIGFGRLSANAVSFLLLPLYTYFLSPQEFGTIDLIISYVTLLAPLLILQLDRAAFRFLIDARGDKDTIAEVITNTLAITLAAIILVLALYGVVNVFVVIPFAALVASAMVILMISLLVLQFARGLGSNKLFAIASALSGVVLLLTVLWLVVGLQLGVEGVLLATIAASLSSVVFLFVTLKLHKHISVGSISLETQKRLLSYSWPLVPSAASWWFIRTFDRTIIAIFLGVAATGVYAAASKYAIIFIMLYAIFDLSWTESASEHIHSKNRDRFFSEVYNTSFRIFGALGLGFIATTPFVFDIIIGSEFQAAYTFIPILVIGALFQSVVAQYSAIYIAKKATRQVLVTSLVVAGISLMLNVLLIQFIGLYGAALSSAIAFLVMMVWRHYDVKKFVTISFQGKIFVKLIALYLFTVVLYYLNNPYLNIVNLVVIVASSYLLTRDVVHQMIAKLRSRFSRKLAV